MKQQITLTSATPSHQSRGVIIYLRVLSFAFFVAFVVKNVFGSLSDQCGAFDRLIRLAN